MERRGTPLETPAPAPVVPRSRVPGSVPRQPMKRPPKQPREQPRKQVPEGGPEGVPEGIPDERPASPTPGLTGPDTGVQNGPMLDDQAMENLLTNLLDEMDLYTCNVPEDEDLLVLTVFLFIGKVWAGLGYIDQAEIDDLAIEVEAFAFYVQMATYEDPEEAALAASSESQKPPEPMQTGVVLVPGPDGKPVYDFSIVTDAASMGTSWMKGIIEFVKTAGNFKVKARRIRNQNGRTMKGTLKSLKGAMEEVATNLPMLILLWFNFKSEGDVGTRLAEYKAINADEEVWKRRLTWAVGIFRIGKRWADGIDVDLEELDPDRNLSMAESLSGSGLTNWVLALKSFLPNEGLPSFWRTMEEGKAVLNSFDNRKAAQASLKAARLVAGGTSFNQWGLLSWSVVYWVLRKLFEHSNKRLLAFVNDVGSFEQKHSIVVIRKYVSMHKHKVQNIKFSQAVAALKIKGEKWKQYIKALRTLPPARQEDLRQALYDTGEENYALWKTQAGNLSGLVNGASRQFFTSTGSALINNAVPGVGIGFRYLKYISGEIIGQLRDHIATAGQIAQMIVYLQWRMRCWSNLNDLRGTLVSIDGVKAAVRDNLLLAEAAQLDVDWTMKAARGVKRRDLQNASIIPLLNLNENDDYKIDLEKIDWDQV